MENEYMKIEKLQSGDMWITWKFQMRQILESFDVYEIAIGTWNE